MALLIASNLHKDMAGRPLLSGVSFKLERRERLTIAGRNGAGKTTLLRMLAGEESIDSGELSVARGVRIALHDQRPPLEGAAGRGRGDGRDLGPGGGRGAGRGGGGGIRLRDYVLSGCIEELAVERELAQLEQRMAGGHTDEGTLNRYAAAQGRLEALGGYRWRDRAFVMARGLGFAEEDLERRLDTFSGGQLTRASLARALATSADVLLLDEPTNHLDVESLEWLEQTLAELDAAVMLVAHDRWFLEAVGTAVLELHGGSPSRARFFAGSWHSWRREQAARELSLGRAIERQQAEIARMESFIERFRYKATKARQAQSRLKRLAKMEPIERQTRERASLEFSFKAPERAGRVVFELSDGLIQVGDDAERRGASPEARSARSPASAEAASGGGRDGRSDGRGGQAGGRDGQAGGRDGRSGGRDGRSGIGRITLLEHAELWLERGEHVSLVGPNGAGKTTLIETLAGRRPLVGGKLSTGHKVKIGYLSQHAEELGHGGPPGQSVVEVAQRATGLTPNRARALLGAFLFSGEDAEKPLDGLSGGERRRLSLAILVHCGANVLILDEPTNHLDLESREALEDALRSFRGAVLLVSHDRALLDAVGTRTIAIEDGSLRSYAGGWPEYVRVREERRAEAIAEPGGARSEADGGAGRRKGARSGAGGGRSKAEGRSGAKRSETKGAHSRSQTTARSANDGALK